MSGAGSYTHRLTFQVLTTVDDGTGGQAEPGNWETYVVVWGSLTPAGTSHRLAAGLLQTEVTHRVGCWYRRELLTERRALRVVDTDGLTYAVKAIRDADGRRIRLDADVVQVSEPVS